MGLVINYNNGILVWGLDGVGLPGLVYLAMMILFLPMYSETYLKSKEFKVGVSVVQWYI